MMFRFLLALVVLFFVSINSVFAYIPTYPDDAEYYRCVKATNDYDDCSAQQNKRNLEFIKKQYRIVLANPNIVGWHEKIEESRFTLNDLWDSWTAFRTRVCSLSSKATKYSEQLFEEKISCNSKLISHHKNQMDKIILLLTGKIPPAREDFTYLKIYDHDDEYHECMKEHTYDECLEEELKRSTKYIKDLYKTASEDEMIGKWNNGPDLHNGNYRDMYDSWIAYRNRMCSLSVWAYEKGYGKKGIKLTECLQFYNREKLEIMESLLSVAYSVLDEEINIDNDDGGEAEGKTITPLERRFDAEQNKEDVLSEEENKPVEENKETKNKAPQKKVNIPAWAQ